MKPLFSIFILSLVVTTTSAADGELRFATLGDFKLDSGQTIRDCRIGYRTYGTLAPDRSNAVLVTTWFAGTTESLGGWIGPGKMIDTSRYYVVAIDALGNGVSSSPSNSTSQPGDTFPRFTIRDMVRSQHEVLTRELKIDHLFLVAGLSMGGMQVFQWIVTYPDFMDKALPIVGTPKQTSHDLLLWTTELELIESLRDVPRGGERAMKTISALQALELWTPSYIVSRTAPDKVGALMKTHEDSLKSKDPFDYASQLRAMIAHDIQRDFDGSAERAAAAIKARLLVIVNLHDQMVHPGPARELARLAKAEVVTLTGDCGHLASGCEQTLVIREVRRFLEQSTASSP